MATATTTTTTTKAHINKAHTQHLKPKRRRCRETTISTSAAASAAAAAAAAAAAEFPGHVSSHPTVVSTDNTWCFPASRPVPPPPPPPPSPPALPRQRVQTIAPAPSSSSSYQYQSRSPCSSPSTFRIRFSPGSLSPVMDFTAAVVNGGGSGNGSSGHHNHHEATSSFPSSFSKFNSVLTAGLLNPMSPPPPTDKTRSSPTLFEMMASEPDVHPRTQIQSNNVALAGHRNPSAVVTVQDKQALAMQRISEILSSRSPGNQFNDSSSSDLKLTLSSRDGISVSMNVHRQILVAHSRFFAVKLSDRWAKQLRSATSNTTSAPPPHIVEIADCEDVEVYIETLRLMYCKDLRKKLMREDVPKVLGILKVITKPDFLINFLFGFLWSFLFYFFGSVLLPRILENR